MSAEELGRALMAAGFQTRVEGRGKVAVILAADSQIFADEAVRRTALRLAKENGFSHLALELADVRTDTPAVHRAESAP
jgi:putative aminopeptidase FrvX